MSDFPGANQGARIANAEIWRDRLDLKLEILVCLLKSIKRWLIIIALVLITIAILIH